MCEVCLIEQRDARLAFVPCGHQRFCASCVAHLEQHGSASLLVWLWWLERSSHDVEFQLLTFVLHLHKLCCQLCCQLCCTDYVFIIQLYLSYRYTWHLKNNNWQNVTPALKNRFLDLTPNITRHSCIISAELVVSTCSFINNLVRVSSIVPFHIHLSNKLILKE